MAKLSAVSLPTGDGLTRYNPSSPLSGGGMSYQATGWVLEFSESQLGARLVLHAIAYRLNNDTGMCWPSLETIAKECRMTKPGVIQAIERLQESGELTVDRIESPGRGSSNRYSMPKFLEWWAEAREIKGKKGKPYYEKGKPDESERVNAISEKGKQGLPEPEVKQKEEEQKEEEQKEESVLTLPLCKEERRAIPKPVREPKVRKGFQKTLPPKREYVPAPKPPETWNWFAKMWRRYTDVFPVGRPEHWETLEKLYSDYSATGLEDRLSRWMEQRDHKTNAWSALEFLNECPLMDEKEAGDIQSIVNEE